MLQKQMPVWVSHYPPDSCQEDGDRPAATCALEVREQGWVGGTGAEGRRPAQGGLGSRQTPETWSALARAAPAWHWETQSGPVGTRPLGGRPSFRHPQA